MKRLTGRCRPLVWRRQCVKWGVNGGGDRRGRVQGTQLCLRGKARSRPFVTEVDRVHFDVNRLLVSTYLTLLDWFHLHIIICQDKQKFNHASNNIHQTPLSVARGCGMHAWYFGLAISMGKVGWALQASGQRNSIQPSSNSWVYCMHLIKWIGERSKQWQDALIQYYDVIHAQPVCIAKLSLFSKQHSVLGSPCQQTAIHNSGENSQAVQWLPISLLTDYMEFGQVKDSPRN